jgi:predicted kinase
MQRIYVFFGMVASGKSTLARSFADRHGMPYYNTDRVRKELAGLAPTSRRPDGINQGIYTKEFTRRTYQAMLEMAAKDLGEGRRGVVLDGSYHHRQERDRVRRMASGLGVDGVFIQCVCGDEEVKRRLEKRSFDPESVSDGRWEIYRNQKMTFEPPNELSPAELVVLHTDKEVAALLQDLEDNLDRNTG